jgi:hypothetical protein
MSLGVFRELRVVYCMEAIAGFDVVELGWVNELDE